MELTKDEINKRLYAAAAHLFEAGMALKEILPSASERFINTADEMMNHIHIDEQIISNEKITSILDEIFGEN